MTAAEETSFQLANTKQYVLLLENKCECQRKLIAQLKADLVWALARIEGYPESIKLVRERHKLGVDGPQHQRIC